MFRKHKCQPDWELIDILNYDLDYHNAELWKMAAEIERLRDQLRTFEVQRNQCESGEEPF